MVLSSQSVEQSTMIQWSTQQDITQRTWSEVTGQADNSNSRRSDLGSAKGLAEGGACYSASKKSCGSHGRCLVSSVGKRRENGMGNSVVADLVLYRVTVYQCRCASLCSLLASLMYVMTMTDVSFVRAESALKILIFRSSEAWGERKKQQWMHESLIWWWQATTSSQVLYE